MFSIETTSGKLIRSHSYFKQEEEILLPPGIYLEVVDRFSSSDGLNIIHLRETTPPYKMLTDPFDVNQLRKALPDPKPVPNQGKKQEQHHSTSGTPKTESHKPSTEKAQDKYSSPSVTPKSSVQSPPEKSKFNIYFGFYFIFHFLPSFTHSKKKEFFSRALK